MINKDIPYLYGMKPFKFLTNNRTNPIVFNINVIMDENPFGRIMSYVLYIEPYELEHTDERTGSIRDIITGVVQLPTQVFNGVLIKRRDDGEYSEINYDNVDEVNVRNLIFDINDRITLRYRDMQYETI